MFATSVRNKEVEFYNKLDDYSVTSNVENIYVEKRQFLPAAA